MIKFNFIGRGSAFNEKEHSNSAFYKKNGKMILIDCGEDIFKQILKKDLLNGVHDILILITHMHSDHIGSLSSLLFYLKYKRGIIANVYFPNKYELEEYLRMNGNLSSEYNYYDIESDFYMDEISICHEKVNHIPEAIEVFSSIDLDGKIIERKRKKKFNSYLYTFLDNQSNFTIYSGDTNECVYKKMEDEDFNEYNVVIYQDTCLADYEGNVHYSVKKLIEDVKEEHRKYIYCMHLDNSNELIDIIKENGFNVVETI